MRNSSKFQRLGALGSVLRLRVPCAKDRVHMQCIVGSVSRTDGGRKHGDRHCCEIKLPAVMARLFFFVLLFPLLCSSVTGLRRSDFPPSFLFGAGTSAYQVRAVRQPMPSSAS